MSLRTVLFLSDEWHNAVADSDEVLGHKFAFPQPWYPVGEVRGYSIEPIMNAAELYQEGKAMHHCVSTFAHDVAAHERYIYSVKRDGDRVATVELVDTRGHIVLGQVRGRRNTKTSAPVMRAIRSWMRENRRLHGDAVPKPPPQNVRPLIDHVPPNGDENIPY